MGLTSSRAQIVSHPGSSPSFLPLLRCCGTGAEDKVMWQLRTNTRPLADTSTFHAARVLLKGLLTSCAGGLSPSTETRLINCNSLGCRVEIKHLGQWGTVCGDGFSAADARVTCRAMGFAGGQIRCA